MSFYFALLACAAFSAFVIALVGFAVFVWLQVLNELEERRTLKKRQRESRF